MIVTVRASAVPVLVTTNWNTASWPGTISGLVAGGVIGAIKDLAMVNAVSVSTAVEVDAVSFAGLVFAGPATVALLSIVPVNDEARVPVTVIESVGPTARAPLLVHTSGVACGQDHPMPVAVTPLSPVGSVSVTVMGPVETEGPRLDTPMVHDTAWPARGVPLIDLVIARSAAVTTDAVFVSDDATGSAVSALTAAVFVTVVPAGTFAAIDAETLTPGNDAPLASVPARVQVKAPVAVGVLQAQPAPDAAVIVTPAGSVAGVSVIRNGVADVPTAVSGPELLNVIVQALGTVVPARSGDPVDLTTVTSAWSMWAVAVFVSVEYGPTELPVAPVASVALAFSVLVCGLVEPAIAVGPGVAE